MYPKILQKLGIICFVIGIMSLLTYTSVDGTGICNTQTDSFAISPDGTLLATYSLETNSIYVFDTSDYELLEEIQITQDRVTAIIFSTDNELIAWGASDDSIDGHSLNGSLYLYDTGSQTVFAIIENIADVVDQMSFLNGSEFLSLRGLYPGYEKSDIQIWDVGTESLISKREAWSIVPAYNGNVASIFLGTTLSLGISNEFSYQIEIWEGQSNMVTQLAESSVPVSAMTFSNDNTLLATGNIDGQITLWDAGNLTNLTSFFSNTKVEYLAFITEHTLLVAGDEGDGNEMRIEVWSIAPEPKLLNLKELSATQIGAVPTQTTVYVLKEDNGSTQLALWSYEEDILTNLNLYCD